MERAFLAVRPERGKTWYVTAEHGWTKDLQLDVEADELDYSLVNRVGERILGWAQVNAGGVFWEET